MIRRFFRHLFTHHFSWADLLAGYGAVQLCLHYSPWWILLLFPWLVVASIIRTVLQL